MKIKTSLLRGLVGKIGVVLVAVGVLDNMLRQGDITQGWILIASGIALILISATEISATEK